jgi:hypothetical protein
MLAFCYSRLSFATTLAPQACTILCATFCGRHCLTHANAALNACRSNDEKKTSRRNFHSRKIRSVFQI